MPEYLMEWKETLSATGRVIAENEEEALEKVKAGLIIDPETDNDNDMIEKSIRCLGLDHE